jgi:hypothetical protein
VVSWANPANAGFLLAYGADIRVRDAVGMTPLHSAALYGDEATIGLLIDFGAEINARDASGWTPLHSAARLGRVEEATVLVRRGADVSIRDDNGRTPLDVMLENSLLGELREPLQRLLGGFMTVRVVETRPDSLVVRVEGCHSKYPDAQWEAKEQGAITVPSGLLPEVPEVGDLIECPKGLSPTLDRVWRDARSKDLGIERVR